MKTTLSILISIICLATGSYAQQAAAPVNAATASATPHNREQIPPLAAPSVTLSDLRFTPASIFAYCRKDSLHTFCLLGTGFFGAKHSTTMRSTVMNWLYRHPNARVIPIATYYSFTPARKGAKQTYIWVVDNTDTLNNCLVRQGCFAGKTMQRPHGGTEMTALEKELYGNIAVHIDQRGYDNFITQIKGAETRARQEKLGIWHKGGIAVTKKGKA